MDASSTSWSRSSVFSRILHLILPSGVPDSTHSRLFVLRAAQACGFKWGIQAGLARLQMPMENGKRRACIWLEGYTNEPGCSLSHWHTPFLMMHFWKARKLNQPHTFAERRSCHVWYAQNVFEYQKQVIFTQGFCCSFTHLFDFLFSLSVICLIIVSIGLCAISVHCSMWLCFWVTL